MSEDLLIELKTQKPTVSLRIAQSNVEVSRIKTYCVPLRGQSLCNFTTSLRSIPLYIPTTSLFTELIFLFALCGRDIDLSFL